jgi:hypothetical protein
MQKFANFIKMVKISQFLRKFLLIKKVYAHSIKKYYKKKDYPINEEHSVIIVIKKQKKCPSIINQIINVYQKQKIKYFSRKISRNKKNNQKMIIKIFFYIKN